MQMEAHGSVPDTQKRPDNFAVSPDGTMQIAVDVRTCLVTSPTNCKKAAQSTHNPPTMLPIRARPSRNTVGYPSLTPVASLSSLSALKKGGALVTIASICSTVSLRPCAPWIRLRTPSRPLHFPISI